MTVRTHYDNLKVSRDAPLEVIKAAYKALTLMYHPDRNTSDPHATQTMQTINAAFEVLSDKDRRDDHDRWILEQERLGHYRQPPQPHKRGLAFATGRVVRHVLRHWVWYLIAWAILHYILSDPAPPRN